MVAAQKILCVSSFDELPKASDFRTDLEEIAPLQQDEVLVKAVYISVDPYVRVIMPELPLNATVIGEQIAVVVQSRNKEFPVESYVWGYFGWRDFSVFKPAKQVRRAESISPYILQPIEGIPWSSRLGVLGMTGNSAYFGLLKICQPKAGETVVVTGAAGAVGSIAGQIAKIVGCKVIGIAGSRSKCEWLISDLSFDYAIDYKSENVQQILRKVAPNGIDCFFDNVGGELSSVVISLMNDFGRIAVCGSISAYNVSKEITNFPKATVIQPAISTKQLKMEGFVVTRWLDCWNEGISQLQKWIDSGELSYRETITEGFENLPKAFIGLFNGDNFGKALVKV